MVSDVIFVGSLSFWGILLSIVGGILLVLFVLGLCACQKLKHRAVLDGVLVEENGNAITNQPTSNKPCENGGVNLSTSDADLAKLKVPTLQRKLPDIPVLPISVTSDNSGNATETQSPDTGSELYATVDTSTKNVPLSSPKKAEEVPPQDGKANADAVSTEPSASFHNPVVLPVAAAAVDALSKQLGEATQSSGDSDAEHPYSHIQPHSYLRLKHSDHPYDWLKGQTSEERDTDTDNYDDPHVYAQSSEWTNTANEPPPPPIPEKRYDIDNAADDVLPPTQLTAANAVSGRVSASDIPYVTSPVDSPTHQQHPVPEPRAVSPLIEPQYNGSETSTGSGPNVRYTSISVREPLANLRSQPQLIQESYYAVVSDDDIDQTYAEIHAGQTTSSDSPAYAAVEFTASTRELPPVPPPVESLRSLRSNHSGQDSISSTISGNTTDATLVSASAVTNETSSGSSFTDVGDLYSTIEKRHHSDRNADRKTIHTSVPHSYLHLDNVEDMYAKVLKNKRLSLHQDFASSDGLPSAGSSSAKHSVPSNPPSSPLPFPLQLEDAKLWSFSDSRRPRSMIAFSSSHGTDVNSLMTSSSAHDVSEFSVEAISNADPDYEEVGRSNVHVDAHGGAGGCDPGYERIREKFMDGASDPGYEMVKENEGHDPGYESILLTSLHNDNLDPAYETVNIHAGNRLEPGYEVLNLNHSDPGYEQIRKHYTDSEAGYETITRHVNEHDNEPGYERINPEMEGASEPGYERVNHTVKHEPEPGYEQVNHRTVHHDNEPSSITAPVELHGFFNGHHEDDVSSNDPGYEKVNFLNTAEGICVDNGKETDSIAFASLLDGGSYASVRAKVETHRTDSPHNVEANNISQVELKVNHATMSYVYNPCYDFDNPEELHLDGQNSIEVVEPPYATVNKECVKLVENGNNVQAVDVANNDP